MKSNVYIAAGGNRFVKWNRVGRIVSLHVQIPAKTTIQQTIAAVATKLAPRKKSLP